MIQRQALLQYLDSLLEPGYFKDYAPNGLQVQGRDQVKTLVTGVTATQALIDRAIELEATLPPSDFARLISTSPGWIAANRGVKTGLLRPNTGYCNPGGVGTSSNLSK